MIDNYQKWISSEIKRWKFGSHPKSLYEPLRYIMQLGGKRLRPMLTLLSYSLYREDPREIVPIAVAIEAFHNFTLLHDDIMDKAPLRRGKATVHEKWNTNTAILSGDVMLVKVYEQLLKVDGRQLKEVLTAFNQCAAEVCEGQQMDMEFESRASITKADYLEMIRLKTAVLLGFSLELGAVLGGAPLKDRKALYEFGVNMGLGFQLKDDLLDVYGDQKKFGKQVGGDIVANKKTFLLITALAKAKGKRKKELLHWISSRKFPNQRKIESVTALYDQLGVRVATEKKVRECFELGFIALGKVKRPAERKALLGNFALTLVERQQ